MPTVSSIILKPDLTAWSSVPVVFRPAANTSYHSADLVRTYDVRKDTDSNGFFTTSLAPGYYWVWIGVMPPFVIEVPEGSDTYLLKDLLYPSGSGEPTTEVTVGDNYRITSGCLQLLDAALGTWHPVTWSTATGDDAFAVGAAEAIVAGNYQITGTCLQILHADTSAWHVPFVAAAIALAQGGAGELQSDSYRVYNSLLQIQNLTTGYYHSLFLYNGAVALGPATS